MLHMPADESAAKQRLRMQPLLKRTAMVIYWQKRAAMMSSLIGQSFIQPSFLQAAIGGLM